MPAASTGARPVSHARLLQSDTIGKLLSDA